MIVRTYSQLMSYPTFEERYEYLRLTARVGDTTFGFERYLNQRFYASREWKLTRDQVIARDYGRDLAFEGREIHDRIYIHHMNPMSIEDFEEGRGEDILNPEFLISTTHRTHNAIHYGSRQSLQQDYVERRPGDHLPWRNRGE